MNYEFFSNIFCALVRAEEVAIEIKDESLLAQTSKAKASILAQFDRFFPSTVEDVIKRPGFSCKPFFEIVAEYPFLLEGREKKFLKFVASVADYAKVHKGENIVLDKNVVKIMGSRYIDDFVWRQVVKDRNCNYFVSAVNSVLQFIFAKKRGHASKMLTEELLPSWTLAFPEIVFNESKS